MGVGVSLLPLYDDAIGGWAFAPDFVAVAVCTSQ